MLFGSGSRVQRHTSQVSGPGVRTLSKRLVCRGTPGALPGVRPGCPARASLTKPA